MSQLHFDQLPAIFPCYLRALVSGRSAANPDQVNIPDCQASVADLAVDPARLARFSDLIQYPASKLLPPTFPQALAAPLHLSLLTAREFPLPATGLVHLSNTIRCDSGIGSDEALELVATVRDQIITARGIEFTLETTVSVAGEHRWSASSLLLSRTSGRRHRQPRGERRDANPDVEIDRWQADSDIGRRYAAVSGDYNPIHLHGLTARVFGFKAPIAHGMWSLARSLSALNDHLDPPYEVNADFLRPMLLPAAVRLLRDQQQNPAFSVVDETTGKAYLSGSVA